MSAFDDYYVKPLEKYDDTIDYYGKDDLKDAFNAGLEAAALRVARLKRGYGSERHDETCTLAIEVIRALKEQTD